MARRSPTPRSQRARHDRLLRPRDDGGGDLLGALRAWAAPGRARTAARRDRRARAGRRAGPDREAAVPHGRLQRDATPPLDPDRDRPGHTGALSAWRVHPAARASPSASASVASTTIRRPTRNRRDSARSASWVGPTRRSSFCRSGAGTVAVWARHSLTTRCGSSWRRSLWPGISRQLATMGMYATTSAWGRSTACQCGCRSGEPEMGTAALAERHKLPAGAVALAVECVVVRLSAQAAIRLVSTEIRRHRGLSGTLFHAGADDVARRGPPGAHGGPGRLRPVPDRGVHRPDRPRLAVGHRRRPSPPGAPPAGTGVPCPARPGLRPEHPGDHAPAYRRVASRPADSGIRRHARDHP